MFFKSSINGHSGKHLSISQGVIIPSSLLFSVQSLVSKSATTLRLSGDVASKNFFIL